jgi:hypothetical protein
MNKVMAVLVLLVLTGCASFRVAPTHAVNLTASNARSGEQETRFFIPDSVRFEASGIPANAPIEFCSWYRGMDQCNVVGSADRHGRWHVDVQVLGISLGTWTRWIRIADGKGGRFMESNHVTYVVLERRS